MSMAERERIQALLIEALSKARKHVEDLEAALAYNSALLGIGVDQEAQLGSPPAFMHSLSSAMKYLGLDAGEADLSDYLGIEGDDRSRPKLGKDAPKELLPQDAPKVTPNLDRIAVEDPAERNVVLPSYSK